MFIFHLFSHVESSPITSHPARDLRGWKVEEPSKGHNKRRNRSCTLIRAWCTKRRFQPQVQHLLTLESRRCASEISLFFVSARAMRSARARARHGKAGKERDAETALRDLFLTISESVASRIVFFWKGRFIKSYTRNLSSWPHLRSNM